METFSGNIQINHYDAEGLHHEMEENGKLVTFIYRGDEAIAEESQEDKIRYIRTSVLLASDAESARTYYHYASDEMSSITHVVGENEEILNHYEYDAWGNLTVCEEKVQNRFRFNGQQYDPISQQYYLRARYYNPVIGRFTQEDSYNVDGLNLYAYCRNNPVSYVDPSGNICGRRANTLMDNVLSGKGLTRKERRQLSARLRDEARNGTISDKGRNVARQMGIELSESVTYDNNHERQDTIEKTGDKDNHDARKIIVTDELIRDVMRDAPLKTKQASVCVPMIQEYVNRVLAGETDMPPIKVADDVIVDGNHRYITSRITGIDVESIAWIGNSKPIISWMDVILDPVEWRR